MVCNFECFWPPTSETHAPRKPHTTACMSWSRFAQGDTVGLVINIKEKTGYLVKNGTTVCKVVYSSNNPEQITFALHLGVGDEVWTRSCMHTYAW